MKISEELKLRDYLAASVLQGICSGDWKFDIKDQTWDQIAAKRAYEIADIMIKAREL
jgi:hypothetical protein